MILFAREFLQRIPVVVQPVDPAVHLLDLVAVVGNDLFLPERLDGGIGPMDEGISRTYNPEHKEKRGTEYHVPGESSVFPVEDIFEFAQNTELH